MSWLDRLQTASYTIDKQTITFEYEDVSSEFTNKGTAFNFPGTNRTYVQRLGSTTRQFPIVAFFSGADHDVAAKRFLKLLTVKGFGELNHPLYGTATVVPLGKISVEDRLKSAAGQSAVTVTFVESGTLIFADSSTNVVASIETSMNFAINDLSDALDNEVEFESVSSLFDAKSLFTSGAAQCFTSLIPSVENNVSALSYMGKLSQSITSSIKALPSGLGDLAKQINTLIRFPARLVDSQKLMFSELLDNFTTEQGSSENDHILKFVFASSALAGLSTVVVNTIYSNRTEALEEAELLLSSYNRLIDWYEQGVVDLDIDEASSSYVSIQNFFTKTIDYLITLSFSLKEERYLTLDRDRMVVELAAELYGGLDEFYDQFINDNDLTGDNILIIPFGTTVRYYS